MIYFLDIQTTLKISEQNAPASIEDPGYCIGRCGGICPPCKSEPLPKEDPGQFKN